MNWKHLLAFLALSAAALQAAYGAEEPASGPPAQMTEAERAARVAELIEAVAEAEDPSSAAAAYTRANAMDRSSVKLHETYMARMLKFGLPQIAAYPARELVRIDRDHSRALSVIGYIHGTQRELAEAFDATIQAVRNMQDNPSVLGNAGQLAAWYKNERNRPKVSPAIQQWLEQALPELAKKKEFAQAYERMADGYKQQAELKDKYEQKLRTTEIAMLALRQQLAKAEGEHRTVASKIDSHNWTIDGLKVQQEHFWRLCLTDTDNYDHNNRVRYEDVTEQIRREELIVDRLRAEAQNIRSAAAAIMAEMKVREKETSALRNEMEKAMKRIYESFRWDPPAVDGVVTPAVERFVYTQLPKASQPSDDPEVRAAQKVKVAQNYAANNIPKKALEILTEIVTTYGSTKAAEEAKSLLTTMTAGK